MAKTSSEGRVSGTPKKVERKKKGASKMTGGGAAPSSVSRISGSRRMEKPASKRMGGSGTKTTGTAKRVSSRRMSKPVSGTKRAQRMRKDGATALRWQHK